MHSLAWMGWVALVMAVALTTTNPYYLAIVLLSILLVSILAPKTSVGLAGFRTLLVLGTGLFAISVAIAVINGNYGSHILFTIPGPSIPSWLGGLRIGGPVSGEGLAAAAIRGLAVLCVFLAFGVFNGAVSPHKILRSAPAALFHAGLVVTVGLTLLPSSIEDIRRIREMRALRGAGTGPRNLPALVVPAVIGGLERSMRLAEAMEARGYGSAPQPPRLPRFIGALSAPLLLGAASFWFYYDNLKPYAAMAALAGFAALTFWWLSAARMRQTSRLHNDPVSRLDHALALASVAVGLFAVVGAEAGWVATTYDPFAGLRWPGFALAPALLVLTCAWPALRLAFEPAQARDPSPEEPSLAPALAPEPSRPERAT